MHIQLQKQVNEWFFSNNSSFMIWIIITALFLLYHLFLNLNLSSLFHSYVHLNFKYLHYFRYFYLKISVWYPFNTKLITLIGKPFPFTSISYSSLSSKKLDKNTVISISSLAIKSSILALASSVWNGAISSS